MLKKSPPSGVKLPDTTPPFPERDQDQVVETAVIPFCIRYAARKETLEAVTGNAVKPVGSVKVGSWLTDIAVKKSVPYCGTDKLAGLNVVTLEPEAIAFAVEGRANP